MPGRWPVATGLFGFDPTPNVCLDFLHAKWTGVRRAENLRKPETFLVSGARTLPCILQKASYNQHFWMRQVTRKPDKT